MSSVDEPDPAARAHTFEPELRADPPRRVSPRLRARFGRWIFAILSIVVPGMLCVFAVMSQRTLDALRDHGAKTTGRVVEKRPPNKKELPQLVYEYQVGGASYRVAETRERDVWAATPAGTETAITYLPEDPASSYSEHQLTTSGDTSSTAIALYIVTGILVVICVPFWIYIEKKYGKVRRLAQFGTPAAGVVTSIARFGSASHDHWCVKYQFTSPAGETIEGKTYVYGGEAKMLEAEPSATVLYDPDDPRKHELYAAVAMLYSIVVDEFTLMRQERN